MTLESLTSKNPFQAAGRRPQSIAVMGGALGDEGKGRLTDEFTADFLKKFKKVIHYRDNGGANAGHTVEIGDTRIALHQLSSGVTQKGCVVVMGKEMVIHPDDLILEIESVKKAFSTSTLPAELLIDELAFLCLDTHRAFEVVLKAQSTGSLGSTGRGIAPAYADIIYRHPLQMRDLMARDWEKRVSEHYQLYKAWVQGFGYTLAKVEVPRLNGQVLKLGSEKVFIERLKKARTILRPFIQDVHEVLETAWRAKTPFVFEKAQALGLDHRWGIYPDVTASDCTFDGIFSSTEGIVDPQDIAVRAATIKATYSSSVGTRILPTLIKNKLANKIREDAHEYGSTTKRPRAIAHIDIPMLSYFMKVGRVEYLLVTHLDIAYPLQPIKVCVAYELDGKKVAYRPDQTFLNKVKPIYREFSSWDGKAVQSVRKPSELPKEAQVYLEFIAKKLNVHLLMATVGPKRDQTIKWY